VCCGNVLAAYEEWLSPKIFQTVDDVGSVPEYVSPITDLYSRAHVSTGGPKKSKIKEVNGSYVSRRPPSGNGP
jgi:hypothetical protein